jgi:phage tail-like protein
MAQTGQRVDPFSNFNFLIELDGITRAAFQEVSGLDATIDVIEHREGGQNTTPRKFPGLTKYSNITLRWGMTDDLELYEWHRQAIQGNLQRKNGSVVLLNRLGEEVARWNFVEAWPTKYDAPDLNATGNELAVEAVELVHEGVERVR